MEKEDLKWEQNEVEEEEEGGLQVRSSKATKEVSNETNGHSKVSTNGAEKSDLDDGQEWLEDLLAASKNGVEEGTEPKQESFQQLVDSTNGVEEGTEPKEESKEQLVGSNNGVVEGSEAEEESKQQLVASNNEVEEGTEPKEGSKQQLVASSDEFEEGTEPKEVSVQQIVASNNEVEEGIEAEEEFVQQIVVSSNGVEEGSEAKEESKQQLVTSNNGVEEGTKAKEVSTQQLVTSNNGVEEGSEAKEESKEQLVTSTDGVEEGTEAKEGSFKSGHSIYHDKDEDSHYTSKPSIKEQIKRNPGDEGVQKSAALDIQLNGYLKNDSLPSSSVQPFRDLSKDHDIVHKSSAIDEVESADTDLINDSDTDVKDFDVENVLEKQNTHDLYCPNCKSCITKRVILRKRKRKIRVSGEDLKRNKLEFVVDPKVDASRAQETNDQVVRDGAGSSLDGTPPLTAADDYHPDREPEIFRCLSCFSFFIPTGNGFKLFRCFGEKGDKENIRSERTPIPNRNWFSSIFALDKGKASVEQGSGNGANAVKNDARVPVPSDNLKDQSTKPLVIKESASPEYSRSEITREAGGNNLVSENQGAKMEGKKAIDTAGKSENATKSQAGGSVLDFFDMETSIQSNGSAFSKEVKGKDRYDELLQNAGRVSNGNLAQDSLPSSQQTGLKFVITSTKEESLTIEKSETDLKSEVAVLNKGPDYQPILATTASALNGLDANRKPKMSPEVPQEHEQHIKVMHLSESLVSSNGNEFQLSSKDVAHPCEVSQHTITKTKLEIHSEQPLTAYDDALISSVKDALSIQDKPVNVTNVSVGAAANSSPGTDTVITVEAGQETTGTASPNLETHVDFVERQRAAAEVRRIEIVKSIIFGGLAESVTSLSVVSSAAGGDAATLNIFALGMANLFGGLFVIFHNLWELKKDCYEQASNQIMERQVDRYRELLGRRENFILHAVVAVLSYIIFGLVPPLVYGFSFRKSDDRELKLVAVAAAALVCILVLATGKAYVQRAPKRYIKTIATYMILGYTVSGFSFAAGVLFKRLLDKLGIFHPGSTVNLLFPEIPEKGAAWASL